MKDVPSLSSVTQPRNTDVEESLESARGRNMPWTYTIANSPPLRQTSTRNRDAGASFAARAKTKGHAPHLSISDDSHHVTETIGFLYGDDDERDPRRTSNIHQSPRPSSHNEHLPNTEDMANPPRNNYPRKTAVDTPKSPVSRLESPQRIPHPSRAYSFEKTNGQSQSPKILSPRDQSPSDTAQTQFPLNDIDYESSPAAVAQELSNLQALRRMSMDVHAAGDPDLPSLNPAAVPNAPSPTASEDDAARLFWVPARLHPELAPKEFKTFLESKAEQIKRRSGDLSSFTSSPMASRSGSLSSLGSDDEHLKRKKSMLSREVNSSLGYRDGADILDRKRSMSGSQSQSDPNLAELEHLVSTNLHLKRPDSPDEDVDFILPSVPSSSLKRSTKTRYQKAGGAVKTRGDRPQRGIRRAQTMENESSSTEASSSTATDMPSQFASLMNFDSTNLADTLNFSVSKPSAGAQNFSRPAARSPSPPQENAKQPIVTNTFDNILASASNGDRNGVQNGPDSRSSRRHVIKSDRAAVPQIVEIPPTEDMQNPRPGASSQRYGESQPQPPQQRHPERTSSREAVKTVASRPTMSRTDSSISVVSAASSNTLAPSMNSPKQSLEQPSPLPGNDTNTNNLTLIPTLTVDKQSQERKESKKSGWGWLLGKDEDKDKGKGRSGRHAQSHDNTRLDLLQTSIDSSWKRRETLELDRDSLRLDEERKKESQRKGSMASDKKEKESIFSSLFGGKKSKAEKESKKSPRLSPEPPYRELKPDIDYSWTRFTLLEERAIYRMAHIKLANPRRPLHSQVLLSNFMYSYLAKVQQMHPQMNLPSSAKQQKKQQKEQQQQQQQSEEFSTYQRYQQVRE